MHKLYQFGLNKKIKFFYKSCTKIEIRKIYNPTSRLGNLLINLGFSYYFKFLGQKEMDSLFFDIIDYNNLKVLCVGNNKSRQKYIALEKSNDSYIYKKFSINNKNGSRDIQKEIYFHSNIKNNLFIPEYIKNQTVISSYSNPLVTCLVTEELVYEKNKENLYLDFDFLNYFLEEFSLKNIQNYNDEFTYCYSHGDLTPWNVKYNKSDYLIIDWEDHDLRPLYYDVIQYQFSFYCIIKQFSFTESEKKVINNIDLFNYQINKLEYMKTIYFFKKKTYLK